MANQLLTPKSMQKSIEDILTQELEKEYARGTGQVFSLVEITLKDGTVLGPIMLELKPHDIEAMQDVIQQGYKVLTLTNENESILFPAADIKHIKMMRVTSKE